MKAETLDRPFAGRITGIDLTKPVDAERAAQLRALASGYFAVMIFPGYGGPSSACMKHLGDVFGEGFEGADVTNLDVSGNIQSPDDPMTRLTKGNEVWHVDMLAVAEPSLMCMIRAKELPSHGGQTQFADLTRLWPALSEQRRGALAGKSARHEYTAMARRVGPEYPLEMVTAYPGTTHPIVVREPLSGLPVVLIGAHTDRILDSDEDVDTLIAEATVPENVFTHTWTVGDLVVWNNRRVVHRVTPYRLTEERRRLARYDVKGPAPVAYSNDAAA